MILDRERPHALHHQLERALREAIRDGRLPATTALPSTRALAAQLAVSRGVVVEAYAQLTAEGYLASTPGGVTRVARDATITEVHRPTPLAPTTQFDFRPGRPDVAEFPRAAWLRSLRRVLADAPSERLTYLNGHGIPELRLALATYLNRARGACADPADVVICTGFAQGLALSARAMRAAGARRVAVEDPSDPEYRATLAHAGLDSVGVPVDELGVRVDLLEGLGVDGIVVTAAHQYPTGAVLSPERRTALVDWAVRRRALIVEDDYDAEFRYDREPIGAIQGLNRDNVIYAGTASKMLAPGLRLGWLVSPPHLTDRLIEAKLAADMGSAALDQLAFADVLERGVLDHHLRRMRAIYRGRRDTLLAALARHLPDLRPVGAAAGLHVLTWLPDDVDEAGVVAEALASGIAVGALAARRIVPGPGGLIFGYGVIPEPAIEPGVARLAGIVAANRGKVA